MNTEPQQEFNWIAGVKARGLDHALSLTLDALEPLGPLGAQFLWALQPMFGIFGGRAARQAAAAIAEALEEPGGVEELRRQLE